ncbi:hypothetical protein E2C01_041687 [Portunus trituberculatus]|uniref:Uncharacterized protein n=1 Tax=Portunus trituberculatus TaxID=210409 RepID=A0A5B7FR12_PORTR|nr:hypothetical protein [Portunus trituberculatus]
MVDMWSFLCSPGPGLVANGLEVKITFPMTKPALYCLEFPCRYHSASILIVATFSTIKSTSTAAAPFPACQIIILLILLNKQQQQQQQ